MELLIPAHQLKFLEPGLACQYPVERITVFPMST